MTCKPKNIRNRQCGFTLLEVLIALLILSIGLLGLASLQTSGLRSNQMASMRTTSTQLAYDIADRMRANPVGVDAQNYVIATSAADPVILSGENCESITCSTTQMATYDLAQWRGAVRSLPGGTSAIARTVTGAVVTHTITVFWDEYRQGITGTACGPDPKVDLRCMSLTL
ncbi:MAG TPA: type IV pilus modification protein PilV [Gammaproteobacteria bacterium]|nr:type IV pilus modification protein PilV [Gammaproteobacteria bacterium]